MTEITYLDEDDELVTGAEVLARSLKLHEHANLVYVNYDDQLTVEQIAKIIDNGEIPESLHEWADDTAQHGLEACWDELPERDREILEEADLEDQWRETMQDTGQHDWFADLLRHTPDINFRVNLDYEVPSNWNNSALDDDTIISDIIVDFELEQTTEIVDGIRSMLNECGSAGALYVLWRGDVQQIVDWAMRRDDNDDQLEATLTWDGFEMLCFDKYNGSGFSHPVPSKITVTTHPDNVYIDEKGAGHGMSFTGDVCGGFSWDSNNPTINIKEPAHA